jgi:hypothetical protein
MAMLHSTYDYKDSLERDTDLSKMNVTWVTSTLYNHRSIPNQDRPTSIPDIIRENNANVGIRRHLLNKSELDATKSAKEL